MSLERINMIVCGHIDHGKSTFVGRLMSDLDLLPLGRLDDLVRKQKSQKLEYSHLIDSLSAEQSNGITISLSQMAFKYEDQEFAFLDSPGHFEFIQNVITGASKANIGFMMVDAEEGIRESTLRHLYILSFIEVDHVVLLVNKMDLIQYSEDRYLKIVNELKSYADKLGLTFKTCVPISAYNGENLHLKSQRMSWYSGHTVSEIMKNYRHSLSSSKENSFMRFMVQDRYEVNTGSKKEVLVVGELLSGKTAEKKFYSVFVDSKKMLMSANQLGPYSNSDKKINIFINDKYSAFSVRDENSYMQRGTFIYEEEDADLLFSDEAMCSVFWFGENELGVKSQVKFKLCKQQGMAEVVAIENVFDCSRLLQISDNQKLMKGHAGICRLKMEKELVFSLYRNDPAMGRIVFIKDGRICGIGKMIKSMTSPDLSS